MEQNGTELHKVVYRGLAATAQLQEMHNDAIIKRTKLRLQTDTAKEEQEKMDLELRCRQERSERERQIEEAKTRHSMELLALRKEQERKEQDAAATSLKNYNIDNPWQGKALHVARFTVDTVFSHENTIFL